MAIIKETVTGGRQGLRAWLNTNACPEYFASVSYSSSKITAKDANNKTLLEFDGSIGMKVYKDDSHSDTKSVDTSSTNSSFECIKCSGGILINFGTGNTDKGSIIITKTNNGKTAIITGGASTISAALTTSILSTSWGDATDSTKMISFSSSAQNQTQFVPFTTYAQAGTVSYTPKAFYLPATQYASIGYGKISDGTNTYITNGYWAIKDA